MKPHCPVRREESERAKKTSIGREYQAEGLVTAKSQRQEHPDCFMSSKKTQGRDEATEVGGGGWKVGRIHRVIRAM